MALSQKHRSALYDYFAPRIGDDVTEALIAQFPPSDGEEPITRDFLRAEMSDLRAEVSGLRAEIAEVRSDLLVRLTATMIASIGVATAVIVAAA